MANAQLLILNYKYLISQVRMINISEVIETNKMIEQENLDVRTITMGINLLDCAAREVDVLCQNIYNKITRLAKNLVKTGKP